MTIASLVRSGAAAALLLFCIGSGAALAQDYPAREIRIYCGFPPGGGADVFVRYFAEKLRPLAGKPVLVENRTGAAGNVAVQALTRAKPDGHTLIISTGGPVSYNTHLYKSLGYDPVADLTPVSPLVSFPFVLVVDPGLPIQSVSDLTSHVKARQGRAKYGANGGTPIVLAEMLKHFGKFEAAQVMYRDNASAANDLVSGQLDFMFLDSAVAMGQSRQGRLRMLAVSTLHRSNLLPDVPTVAESGYPEVERTSWFAAFLPARTPQGVATSLNQWFQQILGTQETRDFLNAAGAEPYPGTPDDLKRLQADEIAKWSDLVKLAKIEPQ
ncbi:MAG: transporter substrate-binding protein [Hyphomicrobiales bacterium]|nr:transporter substrate-binding protein [Hyphomicrobiales bacterium]